MTQPHADSAQRRARWPRPALMLVTDSARLHGRDLVEVVSAAVDGGVNVVQLRDKELPREEIRLLASALRQALAGRALLLVNSYPDVVTATDADGVHLPERGMTVATARAIVGEDRLAGRSVHSAEAARSAAREGVDYVVAGTVFATASKPDGEAAGVDFIRNVVAAIDVPVLAIGGITAANAADVMAAGAAGIAVIGAIMDANDPRSAAAALREAMAAGTGAGHRC